MRAEARDRTVPASLAQRALWLLVRSLPDPAVYNEPNVYRLKGALDAEALQRAMGEIVRRHEALRTRFGLIDGEPVQIIANEVRVPLPVTDLRAAPRVSREAEARERAKDEARAAFDLERGPLIRVRLLCLADDEHWLLITRHHIARDGSSDVVFAQELGALYAAYRAGRPSPLPEPEAQFSSYVLGEAAELRGEALREQLSYWREKLAGLPVLDLPLDRPRPAMPSHRGARVSMEIGEPLTKALRALAHAEGTTLFTALLASLHVLLSRYSGQDGIATGVAVSGRPRGFERAIGYFTNLLVVRGDLSGAPTFRELLARTQAGTQEAYRHRSVPFAKLVEELAPRRDPSRNPLFQVSLVKATDPGERPDLSGVEVEAIEIGATDTVKFDLDFSVAEERGELAVVVEYATDLFRATTIEGMATQWRTLLENIVERPDERISRLRLLDREGRERIVREWNDTRRDYPADASIAALFAAQAQRIPDAIALTDRGRALDYAGLWRRARSFAQRLRAAGAAPGARVAVCIERSLEEIIALVAVIEAGCTYVPLDPRHPPERLAALLVDAEAAVVIAVKESAHAVAQARQPILLADDALRDGTFAATPASAGDAAYVMYTSGTTGTPKGVVIPHRAVARLVIGSDYLQLGPDDVVAHLSNPAFDAATFEIWGALLNGARLVVIPRATVLSPNALADAFERERITAFFVTTALFQQIAQDAPHAFNGRTVLFGGEASDPNAVARALREGRPKRLLHVYGPTETTTFATWHEVRAGENAAVTVPIGRPIANTEIYLLDREREPVPAGVPGEIYIGGPGLALGYFRDRPLSELRFVAHPFSNEPGARLYRTGDRARWRADGAIEFLGRFDDQIKIRGHRIEPAEVEAALLRLPGVRQAVVLARGSSSTLRQLVAYVVPMAENALVPADLWRELRRTLPDYLVPQRILLLPSLPLTGNGKIDRAALPDPRDVHGLRTAPAKRRTLLEHLIAPIWERLLRIPKVGANESFFDLGGHSLLAAQMLDEIERECGVRLPVTALFSASTIEQLAEAIRLGTPASSAALSVLASAGARPPLFFLHGDFIYGGLYCRGLAAGLGSEQPFYAVHPHGIDGSEVPPSIEAMAADRAAAIRRVRPRGPYFLGGHCNGALVAVEIARRLIEEGDEVPVVVVLDGIAERDSGNGGSLAVAAPPDSAGPVMETWRRYRRIVGQYVPHPFPGRIAVLRSGTHRDAKPDLGWGSLAREVETHHIRGGHIASITRNVAATARCVRDCLDAAYESR